MPRPNNIAAYTAPTPNYPEYISFNTDCGQDIEVTVRSASEDGKCGVTASIVLPPAVLRKLALKLYSYSFTSRA